MKYHITELVDIESIQSHLDGYYEITHFPNAFNDIEGNVLNPINKKIVGAGWTRICTEFHRCSSDSNHNCFESDTALSRLPSEGNRYTLYRCKNGLIDVSIPIVIDGEHLANLFTGQFLLVPPGLDYFRRQAVLYDYDIEQYLEALSEVPVVEEEILIPVLNHMCNFANMISKIGLKEKIIRNRNNEKASDKIKKGTTKKIIPMCCYCNDIRTPDGLWQDVDVYIRNNYHTDISHSFCPACFKEHYPDQFEKYIKNNNDEK